MLFVNVLADAVSAAVAPDIDLQPAVMGEIPISPSVPKPLMCQISESEYSRWPRGSA